MGDVGDGQQDIPLLSFQIRGAGGQLLALLGQAFHLVHDGGCVAAFFFQAGDVLARGVLPGLDPVGLSGQFPPLGVDGDDPIHLRVHILIAGFHGLFDQVGVGAYHFDVQHVNFLSFPSPVPSAGAEPFYFSCLLGFGGEASGQILQIA